MWKHLVSTLSYLWKRSSQEASYAPGWESKINILVQTNSNGTKRHGQLKSLIEEINAESLLYEASFTNIDKYQFFLFIYYFWLFTFIYHDYCDYLKCSEFQIYWWFGPYCVLCQAICIQNTLECFYKRKRFKSRDFAKRRD